MLINLEKNQNQPIADKNNIKALIAPTTKADEQFVKDLQTYFEQWIIIHSTTPTLLQLISDYHQTQASKVNNWNYEVYQQAMMEYERIRKESENNPELQNKLRNAQTYLDQSYHRWYKTWQQLRTFEEKRLDRETPKKQESVILNIKPSDVANLINNK